MKITTTYQTITLNVAELRKWLKQTRQSQLKAALIRAIEQMPIVINRRGVKRGSDLNGWHNAQQAAIKAVRQVLAEEASNRWRICTACDSGLSTTDLTAGRCTNCGVELDES